MYMTPRGGSVAHTKFIPQLRESLVRCPSPRTPPLSPLLQPTQRGSPIMARRMRFMCSFWGRYRTGRGCHGLDMLLRCMCKPLPVSTVKYSSSTAGPVIASFGPDSLALKDTSAPSTFLLAPGPFLSIMTLAKATARVKFHLLSRL